MKNPYYLFIIVGIICLFVAIYNGYSRINFLKTATQTTGTYSGVDHLVSDFKPGIGTYEPQVTYQDKNGNSYTVNSLVGGSNKEPWEKFVGKKVEVLYNESKPEKGIIKGIWNIWGATISFLVLAIGMLIPGILLRKK